MLADKFLAKIENGNTALNIFTHHFAFKKPAFEYEAK